MNYAKTEKMSIIDSFPSLLTMTKDQKEYLNMPRCKKSKIYYNSLTLSMVTKIENEILMRKTMITNNIYDFE